MRRRLISFTHFLTRPRRKNARADKLTAAERMQKIRPMTWEQRDAFRAAAAAREPRHATLFAVLAKADCQREPKSPHLGDEPNWLPSQECHGSGRAAQQW